MKKKETPRPTEAELEILQVLWQSGPATVRLVNDRLNEKRPVGYTTTLKMMQIMHDKGLLRRDERQRSHLYSPVIKERETQQILLNRFLESAFGGSAARLVMQALGNHQASREEIARIRAFLDQLEEEDHVSAE